MSVLKGKSEEVAEDFPLCDDKGFNALMSIGWYEIGELSAGAGGTRRWKGMLC